MHIFINAMQAKEQEIRRQYRDAIKTQMKQYKLLKEQLLTKTSKADQKALLAKLKEDQDRRVAMLSEQYEHSISEVAKHQNVSRDDVNFCLVEVVLDRNDWMD